MFCNIFSNKQGYDMVDCSKSVLSTIPSSHTGFVDKSAQTELNVISTCTQTETSNFGSFWNYKILQVILTINFSSLNIILIQMI